VVPALIATERPTRGHRARPGVVSSDTFLVRGLELVRDLKQLGKFGSLDVVELHWLLFSRERHRRVILGCTALKVERHIHEILFHEVFLDPVLLFQDLLQVFLFAQVGRDWNRGIAEV
jgi:hypothetical protein